MTLRWGILSTAAAARPIVRAARAVEGAEVVAVASRDPALMDVGCYCVSALRLLCGEPERVSAEAVIGATGVDERVVATLRFPGGVLGTLDCAMDAPQHASLELAGTAGRLLVADPWPVPGRVTIERSAGSGDATLDPDDLVASADSALDPDDLVASADSAVDPFVVELREFGNAVREGREPRLDRTDAVAQARVLDALRRSADTGEPVVLTER